MNLPPRAVIHINFIPGELLFDSRPIWSALNSAAAAGTIPVLLSEQLGQQFGGTAIHLETRDYIVRASIRELKAAILTICNLVPKATAVSSIPNTRVLRGKDVESARDRVLLATGFFPLRIQSLLGIDGQVCLRNPDGY